MGYIFRTGGNKKTREKRVYEWFTAEKIHDYLKVIGQLLSYIDKFDAMMVCFHEVMSGNKNFFVKKLKYYKTFFRNVHSGKKLNLLQDIIKQTPEGSHLNLLFSPLTSAQMDAAKKEWKSKAPYGSEDLHKSYWVPAYWLWKISTKNITQAHVWNKSMDGTQILLEMR